MREKNMWDETLIESGQNRKVRKRWMSIPISAVTHAAVAGIFIGMSYWQLDALPPPPSREPLWFVKVHLGRPLAPLSKQKRVRSKISSRQVSIVQPVTQEPAIQEVQPSQSTENIREESSTGSGSVDGVGVGGGKQDGAGNFSGGDFTIADEKPIVIQIGVEQPVLIKKITPIYPPVLLRAHVQGLVLLQAVINREGKIEDVQVIQSPHLLLTKAATDAVSQWIYKPALLEGRPIKVYFNVTVEFRIQ